jgi:pimeloyl-ACP methyl ester carboxylesterase
MDHSVWRYLRRYLSHHGQTALAPDLPGRGSSPGPLLGSVEEMAEWIAAEATSHRSGAGRPLTVIGHSLGGLIALELAARRPEMVSHLVLLACAARMGCHPDLLDAAQRRDQRAIDLIIKWSFPDLGRPSLQPGAQTGPLFSAAAVARRILERGLAGSLAADLRAADNYRGEGASSMVEAPTLVVAGASDRMVKPEAVAALASGIAGAGFFALEGVGHMLMLESPARLRTLIGRLVPAL